MRIQQTTIQLRGCRRIVNYCLRLVYYVLVRHMHQLHRFDCVDWGLNVQKRLSSTLQFSLGLSFQHYFTYLFLIYFSTSTRTIY